MKQLTPTTRSYINIINNMLDDYKLTFRYKNLDGEQNVIFERKSKLLKTFSLENFDGIINFLDGFYSAIQ